MEIREAATAIVAYVQSEELGVPEHVVTAAAVFADACKSLNERLALCDGYLRINQRSEAIRQATLQPDVLQLYTELDIANWDRWAETARRLSLPVPQRLNDRAARRIHGAFVAEQKVVPLLQELRQLALERAPLYQRLDALRRLATAEPTNLVWTEDVRAHEKARFGEIRDLLEDPSVATDLEVIRSLHEELAGEWLSPKPPDITARLGKQYAKIQRHLGRSILRDLNPKLIAAIDDNDSLRVRELHARVKEVAKRYGLPPTSSVWALVQHAEEWLEIDRERRERQRLFERTVAAARSALAKAEDWEDACEQYSELLTFTEFNIPEDIVRAYTAWARGRQLGWAVFVGGIVIALLLGVVLYFAIVR